MGVTQEHVTEHTPLGATLVGDGATFRVWAPKARAVYLITDDLELSRGSDYEPRSADALAPMEDGTWSGYLPQAADGTEYLFWIVGEGSSGLKRDPYARELTAWPAFPESHCIVRDPHSYPWPGGVYQPPRFRDLIIYQLHVGVFYARDGAGNDVRLERRGRLLDLIQRLEYLRDLGVNAVQLLPIQEFPSEFSLGYNGTDYFSPEMDYQVESDTELKGYLDGANEILATHGRPSLELHQIRPGPNQLKLVVDLCHLHGISVILDLVYNHAGGGFDDQSLYFLDRRVRHDNNDSLYFTDQGWAGGLVFAYWNAWVRQFLIDNARFLLQEFHVDGFRYDEVSVIDDHGGWRFSQDLSRTVRATSPQAIQIAEYWNEKRWLAVVEPTDGMGFDAALSDRFRDSARASLAQAAKGADAFVDVEALRSALATPYGFPAAWKAVQCLENHDVVRVGRQPRIPTLCDPRRDHHASWYARSRARVAAGLLLAASGIPMLFMGQEFLEDRAWDDNPVFSEETLISWVRFEQERERADYHRFMCDLIWLRRNLEALRSESMNAFYAWNGTRVLAFHRWVEGEGHDVVVVASLKEATFWGYQLGFPRAGEWIECFNSDYYDHWPNAWVAGNQGRVIANGPPRDGFAQSAHIVIPANGILVLRHA